MNYSAAQYYIKCNNYTTKLKDSKLIQSNKDLNDFIQTLNNNISKKEKMMNILNKLSTELKNETIILKKKELEQDNVIPEENELQLSIIKENSENSLIKNNNDLEISEVCEEKLEEKEKNILQIKNLIKSCEQDMVYINKTLHKYKNSTNELMMESMVFGDKSMVSIDKKDNIEDKDDSEEKVQYFNELNNKYIRLKKKLDDLLSLYKTEKELTEIKKIELEKLENLKIEYDNLKQKRYDSKLNK
jgi:hypothetical protein